jgi:hypothetical protein
LLFDAELLELCPHCRKSALEDADDPIANLGGRESGSVYEPTPTIDLILGTDDHLVGIAIHSDEALGLLDLLHEVIDGHGFVSTGGPGGRVYFPQLCNPGRRVIAFADARAAMCRLWRFGRQSQEQMMAYGAALENQRRRDGPNSHP